MNEEMEFDVRQMVEVVKKKKWYVIYITLIAVVLSGVISFFVMKPVYEGKTSIVIVKENAKIFYEDRYTEGDIIMFQKLLKTYSEIAKSNSVKDKVAEAFTMYSEIEIKAMLSVEPKMDTQIIELKVRCGNPEDAKNIVNVYAECFINESMRVLPAGELTVLDKSKIVDKPVSPNIKFSIVVAFILGLMVSLGLIFLLEYMDSKIRTEEQIKKILNIPVLSVIDLE